MTELEQQIADEVGARASALGALLGPHFVITLESAVGHLAGMWADAIAGDDDRLAAQTCTDLMCALWPDTAEPEPEWWRTPLGRAVARSIGADDAEAVTHSVAAAMLGVPRGSIGTLVYRGELDRHPDGGVLRASVLQRLAAGR